MVYSSHLLLVLCMLSIYMWKSKNAGAIIALLLSMPIAGATNLFERRATQIALKWCRLHNIDVYNTNLLQMIDICYSSNKTTKSSIYIILKIVSNWYILYNMQLKVDIHFQWCMYHKSPTSDRYTRWYSSKLKNYQKRKSHNIRKLYLHTNENLNIAQLSELS